MEIFMRSGFSTFGFLSGLFLLFALTSCMHRPDIAKKPVTIVFFGDSVTWGRGVDRESESFFSLLARDFATGKYGPVAAVNAGKSGDDTAEAYQRIGAVIAARPDIVVIALGLNDCQTRNITSLIYTENIKKIISALPAGTRVVIATSNPFLEAGPPIWTRLNAAFPPYMDEARKLAREKRCPLIDVNAAWIQATQKDPAGAKALYADPTQPSAAGHRLIHEVYRKELEKILKKR
jgi:lysophospholipase L1-like esterase